MEYFWVLIYVLFFSTNSQHKAESVQLEELPLQTFDELFVEEWWDKDEAEDLQRPPSTNFGQNVHHQIDRQNTQFGQIEPNSTDQNPPLTESDHSRQIEPNSTDQNPPLTESDHSGQIELNSTDQNPPLTKSDHSDNAKNAEEQNEVSSSENTDKDEQKRKIIDKFHAMKNEFMQKGKYSKKEWIQIEKKIGKHLKVNRSKLYKWKKEVGLTQRNPKNERTNLVEKFDQRKAELMRAGFKNSFKQEIDKTVAKELGLCFTTIYRWKSELGQSTPNHKHPPSEKKELMKRYYAIKGQNQQLNDVNIAKRLNISKVTLSKWKKHFKRPQFHPNSVNGHSVEENAAENVQEIVNLNPGNI